MKDYKMNRYLPTLRTLLSFCCLPIGSLVAGGAFAQTTLVEPLGLGRTLGGATIQYDASAVLVKPAGGNTMLSLGKLLGERLDVSALGAKCDGTTNDYNAVASAQAAGQGLPTAEIYVPPGCQLNLGGQQVYTVSSNSWRFGPGAAVLNGQIQGTLDVTSTNNETLSKSSSNDNNENLIAAYGLFNAGSGTNGYQKNGMDVRLNTADPSSYTVGSLTDSVVYAKDTVGYESQINGSTGNNFARLYGYHSQATAPAGGDANINVAELEIMNNATYTSQSGKANTKRVIHATCIGSVDCTEGVVVDAVAGTHFHSGYETFAPVIRSDGYAFDLFPSNAGDLTLPPLFGVTPAGDVLTQGKVYLDSTKQTWIGKVGTKVVIGSGATNLFSVDTATGNVVAKGTVTASSTP